MDLLAFAGAWRVERQILERHSGRTGQFDGMAEFTARDGGLGYSETGMLRLPDVPPMHATRRYDWRASDGLIEVWFEDGRFFHAFDPAASWPSAHHDCPPDVYDVTYDLRDPDRWTSRWEVRGPRKDQTLETIYCR